MGPGGRLSVIPAAPSRSWAVEDRVGGEGRPHNGRMSWWGGPLRAALAQVGPGLGSRLSLHRCLHPEEIAPDANKVGMSDLILLTDIRTLAQSSLQLLDDAMALRCAQMEQRRNPGP